MPASILKTATFDHWIRQRLAYDRQPPDYGVDAALDRLQQERKRQADRSALGTSVVPPPLKRQRLVVPHSHLTPAITVEKIQRYT